MLDELGEKSPKNNTDVFLSFFCPCLVLFLPFLTAQLSVTLNLHPSQLHALQSPYVESKCKCIINRAARNAFTHLRITYQSVLLLMTKILYPRPPSLHFPACLNAAGPITLRFKRLSLSGDGDCNSLKDRHRLKLFFFFQAPRTAEL